MYKYIYVSLGSQIPISLRQSPVHVGLLRSPRKNHGEVSICCRHPPELTTLLPGAVRGHLRCGVGGVVVMESRAEGK